MSLLRAPARFILRHLGWRLLDLSPRPARAVVVAEPAALSKNSRCAMPRIQSWNHEPLN